MLQTSARQLGISIDLLGWDFTPQALHEKEIQLPPTVRQFLYLIQCFMKLQ